MPDRGDMTRTSERARPAGLMLLCPDRYCQGGVADIAPEQLRERGIRAVLLDLDNTLVGWQRHDVPDAVLGWLDALRAEGLRLCLVSNTRFGRRLESLSQRLRIPFVRRAWKPRRRGFAAALESLGVRAEETAMIGDQMFTDVLGGNRMGLYTVMVRPMARREFVGTRISRVFERFLLRRFEKLGMI
jgi:HAD superfamily phosphatase (TIGR01668 family)